MSETKSKQSEKSDTRHIPININNLFKRCSKSLDQIPFSRVVGVQTKVNNIVSPFLNFSDLLDSLTKRPKPLRMIPIAVTRREAEFIRREINRREEKRLIEKIKVKEKKKKTHQRHPRLIDQIYGVENYTNNHKLFMENISIANTVCQNQKKPEKKVSDTNKTAKNIVENTVDQYQIIYKVKEEQDDIELKNIEEVNTDLNPGSNFGAEKGTKVKPRGTSTGFSRRQKSFSSTLSSSLTSEKHKKHIKDYFPSNKLEFGFNPLPHVSKPSEIYFNANIDTLQAPRDNSYYNKNEKRSSKYFTSERSQVKKQERKSNLDFLGIFDTRRYFFIPPNRRSENKEHRIINNILSLFS
jgi:hypothetical protein